MKVLGLIPARGGSKGLKNKNTRILNDKPLIAYSIEVSNKSDFITDVVVSSDSDAILNLSKSFGAKVLKRTEENAQDHTPIEPVITETLEQLETNYDLIILLQPTAPIRDVEDIDNVINMFKRDSELESVISVVKLNDIHPARMYNLNDNLKMLPYALTDERKRRQDLNPVYIRNGSIYAIRTKVFRKQRKLILDNKKAYIMPEEKWLNIDTDRDLIIAEILVKNWIENKK